MKLALSPAPSQLMWISTAAALLLCPACSDRGRTEGAVSAPVSGPAAATAQTAPVRLGGGDARAWLTGYGDTGDNSYCAARLRLPLAESPAWEYSYTESEVGPLPSRDLIHYDGMLLGTAGRSVIFGLDAQTGAECFKKDAYFREELEESGDNESFSSLMFSPRGMLAAMDGNGRYYTWDWSRSGLGNRRVSAPLERTRSGFVALDDVLVCSDSRKLRALNLRDLEQVAWADQLAVAPRGVVAGGGSIIAWNRHGLLVCLDTAGNPRWRSDEGTRVLRVVIPPGGQRAYVIRLMTEELICRDLNDGRELWRYRYSELLDTGERRNLLARLNTLLDFASGVAESPSAGSIILIPQALSETPYGLVLAMQSGDTVLLDPATGSRRWHSHAGALVEHALCFENGILLHLSYSPRLDGRPLETILPFQIEAPDWAEIAENDRTPTHSAQRQALPRTAGDPRDAASDAGDSVHSRLLYGRMLVLNPADGKALAVHVEESPAGGSILPALGRIIVAAERPRLVQPGSPRGEPCRIIAYDWLEQGAD